MMQLEHLFSMSTATSDPFVSPPKPAAGTPARVLYADDMKELRELIRLILHRAGYQIETVPDGLDALQRLQANPDDFDLLITDHHMPGMNGLDLVQRLRATPYAGKIMVFSSELNPTVHHAYRRLGVELILPKPVRPAQLRQIMAELLPVGR